MMFVDRQPVCKPEFVWFMQQERAGLFQYVKSSFNVDYGSNFWDRDLGGTTPRQILQQRTIRSITREKVEQTIFHQLGLIENTSYDAFLDDLERTNKERAESASQGKIVYGPVRFSQVQYYENWIAGLRIRAIEKLDQTRWKVTEGQIRDFYEHHKENFRSKNAPSTGIGEANPLQKPTAETLPPLLPFEKVQKIARSQYLDKLYDEQIDNRVKKAEVILDMKQMANLPE